MQYKPLLTIAIPTYNRIEQIKKQVRFLIPQLTDEVRLVIIDNHSDVPVIDFFTEVELNSITIVRNNANRGILGNWLACFDNCQTSWLWSVSDDDSFIPNVVEIVLHLIKNNNDSVFINLATNKKVAVTGLNGYCSELRDLSVYTDSFWMTKCVFNFEKLKSVHYLNYFYATTMISPLVMILKYLEFNPYSKIILDNTKIISGYEMVNTWLKSDLVKFSILTFDIMDISLHPFLRKTLFYSQLNLNLSILSELAENKKITKQSLFYSLRLMYVRFGFLRMLYTFPKKLSVIYIKVFSPQSIINLLRKIK